MHNSLKLKLLCHGFILETFSVSQGRLSSHRVFVRRPSTLYYNRCKDVAHFYVVGLGIIPVVMVLGYIHIVYGKFLFKQLL